MKDETRNRIILGGVAGVAAAGAALLAYGALVEPRRLKVSRVTIRPNPRLWPPEIPPFTVAQISDLHIGGMTSLDTVREAIDEVNKADVDLIALTGDIIGSEGQDALPDAERAVSMLRQVRSGRLRLAVLGNHDHQAARRSAQQLTQLLEAEGWIVLNNSTHRLEHGGHPIWIVGVDDATTYHDSYARATASMGPDDQPRLFLCHWPDLVEQLQPADAAVMLSGHTHGGHIDLPGILPLALRHAKTGYRSGLYEVNGVQLYINRGLGGSTLPFRIKATPEVTILTIKS